jgi:integral membrane protein
VKSLLTPYRVMANIVGVLLIVLVLIGLPLHYLSPDGSQAESIGDGISQYLGVAHGWLYMIFLVVAFLLSRRADWDLGFTVTTLLAGTVPIASFWAEHRATADVRRRIAAEEQAGRSSGPGAQATGETTPSRGA